MKELIFSMLILITLLGCESNKTESNQNKGQDVSLSAIEVVNK